MTERIIDLAGVATVKSVKELTGSDALAYLWGLPVREEVVRCKDCIHRRKAWNGHRPNFIGNFFCSYTGGHEVKPNDFCSRGERRDS